MKEEKNEWARAAVMSTAGAMTRPVRAEVCRPAPSPHAIERSGWAGPERCGSIGVMSRWLALAVLLFLLALPAHAQAPGFLPLQGFLSDLEDAPIDAADLPIHIALYPSERASRAIYEEDHQVDVVLGRFTLDIGRGEDAMGELDAALFATNAEMWVGITVDDTDEMPRFVLGSTPYALVAERAASAATADTAVNADNATMCIQAMNAGTSGDAMQLGGEPPEAYQRKITGACDSGQYLSAIGADGTVTCATDRFEIYAAGDGLTLASNTFAVDPGAFQRRIGADCPAGSAVTGIAQDGTLTCTPIRRPFVVSDAASGTTDITTICTHYVGSAVTVTAPAPGRVRVGATVRLLISHGSGVTDTLELALAQTTTACDTGVGYEHNVYSVTPAAMPSYSLTDTMYSLEAVFTVPSAGTFTYYLNGEASRTNHAKFWFASLTATYFPD